MMNSTLTLFVLWQLSDPLGMLQLSVRTGFPFRAASAFLCTVSRWAAGPGSPSSRICPSSDSQGVSGWMTFPTWMASLLMTSKWLFLRMWILSSNQFGFAPKLQANVSANGKFSHKIFNDILLNIFPFIVRSSFFQPDSDQKSQVSMHRQCFVAQLTILVLRSTDWVFVLRVSQWFPSGNRSPAVLRFHWSRGYRFPVLSVTWCEPRRLPRAFLLGARGLFGSSNNWRFYSRKVRGDIRSGRNFRHKRHLRHRRLEERCLGSVLKTKKCLRFEKSSWNILFLQSQRTIGALSSGTGVLTTGDMHDLRLDTAAFACSATCRAFFTEAVIDSVLWRFFCRYTSRESIFSNSRWWILAQSLFPARKKSEISSGIQFCWMFCLTAISFIRTRCDGFLLSFSFALHGKGCKSRNGSLMPLRLGNCKTRMHNSKVQHLHFVLLPGHCCSSHRNVCHSEWKVPWAFLSNTFCKLSFISSLDIPSFMLSIISFTVGLVTEGLGTVPSTKV